MHASTLCSPAGVRADREGWPMTAFLLVSGAETGILAVVYVAVVVFEIAALWQVFVKAGEAGWKAIIPIWNLLILLKVVGRHRWWIILFIIPIVNVIVWLIVAIDLAKSYGKGVGFGLGLFFFQFIFVPILGFGSAHYAGPAAGGPRAIEL
jgi:hypothetical protein